MVSIEKIDLFDVFLYQILGIEFLYMNIDRWNRVYYLGDALNKNNRWNIGGRVSLHEYRQAEEGTLFRGRLK